MTSYRYLRIFEPLQIFWKKILRFIEMMQDLGISYDWKKHNLYGRHAHVIYDDRHNARSNQTRKKLCALYIN